MEEYRAIPLFRLVSTKQVLESGYKIMGSLWAYAVKFDKDGIFQKLNPRWCIMGTNMDTDIYESHNEVMQKITLNIMAVILGSHEVIDFQFDMKNAFQNTPASEEGARLLGLEIDEQTKKLPKLYCRQARGFVEYGPNGEELCSNLHD